MRRRRRARSMRARQLRRRYRTWHSVQLQRMRSTTPPLYNNNGRPTPPRPQTAPAPGKPTCHEGGTLQQALRTKLLVGILAAVTALGVLLAHQLRANHQTAVEVHKLADEREKAAQIDRDDKAAIQKIRERNAQRAATAPTK